MAIDNKATDPVQESEYAPDGNVPNGPIIPAPLLKDLQDVRLEVNKLIQGGFARANPSMQLNPSNALGATQLSICNVTTGRLVRSLTIRQNCLSYFVPDLYFQETWAMVLPRHTSAR